MSKTIYLYVKTHNKTGLKYLGKTTQNPYKYIGSGVYWTSHIKKHGKDISTNILFQSSSLYEITKIGQYYSDLWNIVQSDNWANLIIENGSGGSLPGRKVKPETLEKMRNINIGKKRSPETMIKVVETKRKKV